MSTFFAPPSDEPDRRIRPIVTIVITGHDVPCFEGDEDSVAEELRRNAEDALNQARANKSHLLDFAMVESPEHDYEIA